MGELYRDSMFVCVFNYYLAKVEDVDIKKVLQRALDLSQQYVQVVTKIFRVTYGAILPHTFRQ